MNKSRNIAATLLVVAPSAIRFMDAAAKEVQAAHGTRLGRVGIARGVLNGIVAARLSLTPFRSEWELSDFVRDAVIAAASRGGGNA